MTKAKSVTKKWSS